MSQMIVFLEDDAATRRHTTEALSEKGYEIKGFSRIDQAKEYFNDHHSEIACVITDLNLADTWLGKFRKESDGGYLSGWVWLQRFVFTVEPDMQTIIYSGFVDRLTEYLTEKNQLDLLRRDNIKCVSKGAMEHEGFSQLLSTLEGIINNKKQ